MSIYSEYAHGYMNDEEFAQAYRNEEWLERCRTARNEERDAFNDWQGEAEKKIQKAVDDLCNNCEFWHHDSDNECCDDCIANKVDELING